MANNTNIDESGGGTNASRSNFLSGIFNSRNFLSGSSFYGQVGLVVGTMGSLIKTPNAELNANNKLASDVRGLVSQALLTSGNPYAMAAGAAVMAVDKTGGYVDASKGLGKGNDAMNMMAAFAFPGAGWFTKKTDTYKMSDDMKSMASGYASSINDGQKAMPNSGAKILFGKDKANRMISKALVADNTISGIKKDAIDDFTAALSMAQYNGISNQFALSGGYNQTLARAASKGMMFEEKMRKAKETHNKILATAAKNRRIAENKELLATIGASGKVTKYDKKKLIDLEIFKDGGSIEQVEQEEFFVMPWSTHDDPDFLNENVEAFKNGGQMNVIPEGALHAHKHHMDNAEDLTKKGIPVVDNDGNQQAEIERNEIIFNKETSTKLEELWKKYKESKDDSIAIEAGKLLADEIINNTDDRTGLINQVV